MSQQMAPITDSFATSGTCDPIYGESQMSEEEEVRDQDRLRGTHCERRKLGGGTHHDAQSPSPQHTWIARQPKDSSSRTRWL